MARYNLRRTLHSFKFSSPIFVKKHKKNENFIVILHQAVTFLITWITPPTMQEKFH